VWISSTRFNKRTFVVEERSEPKHNFRPPPLGREDFTMKTAVILASLIASASGFAAKKAAVPAVKVSSFEGELGVQQPVSTKMLGVFIDHREDSGRLRVGNLTQAASFLLFHLVTRSSVSSIPSACWMARARLGSVASERSS
jgi:hypothetical protein